MLILSGTNTFTGGIKVAPDGSNDTTNLQVVFASPGALPASGAIGGSFEGIVAGAGYAIDQNFINRLGNGSSAALAADSSNNLDFSQINFTVPLGAINGTHTYSGVIAPISRQLVAAGGATCSAAVRARWFRQPRTSPTGCSAAIRSPTT